MYEYRLVCLHCGAQLHGVSGCCPDCCGRRRGLVPCEWVVDRSPCWLLRLLGYKATGHYETRSTNQ